MRALLSYLPNFITSIRLVLTGPIVWALLVGYRLTALCLLVVAALTDWLDGWLARRYTGWKSELGAFLDPMADKVLLMSTFLTFSYLSWIPFWVIAIAVGRDIGILIGIAIYRVWIGRLNYRPIFMSKLNTVLQITLVILLLVQRDLWPLSDLILKLVSMSMVGTSILSLGGYVWLWALEVRHHVKGSP